MKSDAEAATRNRDGETGARHCETPALVGLDLSIVTVADIERPRLQAAVIAPDWNGMLQEAPEAPEAPAPEAPPPPPVAPKRPKVDAHRIAASFPAMMQAGLVRVEPGFATAVLELRPLPAPATRRMDPEMVGITGTVANPQYGDGLPSSLRQGAPQRMEACLTQSFRSLRQVEEIPETLLSPAAMPPFSIRKLSAARVRPEVRVPLRYLPMPHFQLPCAAADWSS